MRVVLLLVVVVVVGVLIRATLFSGGEETPIVAEVSAPASEEVSEPASERNCRRSFRTCKRGNCRRNFRTRKRRNRRRNLRWCEPKEPPAPDETQPETRPRFLIAPKFDVVRVDESPITDGAWQVSLPDVAVGEHGLLVEALDETNTITATIDSTLNRVSPQTADGNRQVTIQAGDHL